MSGRTSFPRSGVYQHYKGPLYQVLGVAHDANDSERIVVVYIGLELNPDHTGPRLAVRTVEDFDAEVDGVPRFTYLGDTWQGSVHLKNKP